MKNLFFTIIFTIMSVLAFSGGDIFAQTSSPQLMITWKAGTYVPPGYQGKALPASNTFITASVELLDGSRLIDLSRQTVYWYVNGNLIKGGKGIQSATFPSALFEGDKVKLRVDLPQYGDGSAVKTIEIPTIKPQAVIEAPFPGNAALRNSAQVKASGYFFNTRDMSSLDYSWTLNGQPVQNKENPGVLNLKTASSDASSASIMLSIKNGRSEAAVSSISVTIKQ